MSADKPTGLAAGKPVPTKVDELCDLKELVASQANQLAAQAEQMRVMMARMEQLTSGLPAVAPSGRTKAQEFVDSLLTERLVKEKLDADKFKADELWFSVESDIRSQVVINETYQDGDKLFRISLGSGKRISVPPFVVRGHSKEECHARYDKVCGVIGISANVKQPEWTTYFEVDMTNDPEAQRLASMTRENTKDLPLKPRVIVPV